MKQILIIGGCGYIGTALNDYLDISDEYNVVSVDLEWYHSRESNRPWDFATLTVEELSAFDVVILLAGHSSVPMSVNSHPESVIANNVLNFGSLFGKISKCPKKPKFIYAGSSSVYNGIMCKADETFELFPPSNIYDSTKQMIDQIARAYHSDVEYYGLRFGTVNGISKHTRTDIMINGMVKNALANKEIKLFNPEIRRPILWIHDLVRAVEAIIRAEDDNRGIYNLASFNSTAEKIARTVAEEVGAELKVVEVEQKVAPYDFAISSRKFEQTFAFKFEGTTKLITREVLNGLPFIHTSDRNNGVTYL
jgi:nucleoside-diphosphate-sugar epimerase